MKPIFFPFSYISRKDAEILETCFRQIVIYMPSKSSLSEDMDKMAKKEVLEIRMPFSNNEDKLDSLINDFKTWADLHQGSSLSFFKTQTDKIPFFEKTFPVQIKAEIKKTCLNIEKERPAKQKQNLLMVRMFLRIAQEFDMQNLELNKDIELFEDFQENMMKNLKGEEPPEKTTSKIGAGDKRAASDDPGSYMTIERLEAWNYLFQQDLEISGLFITNSRAVFGHLIDKFSEAEKVLELDSVPQLEINADKIEILRENLTKHLEMLINNSNSDAAVNAFKFPSGNDFGMKFSLILYLIPGISPRKFFADSVGDRSILGKRETEGTRFQNTLVGLMQA